MNTDSGYQTNAFPKLLVRDLHHSTRWYRVILGYQLVYQMPGPGGHPALSHLRWAQNADLMLVGENSGTVPRGSKGVGVTLTYTLENGSLDDLANRIRKAGYTQLSGPHNRPWNVKELIVIDPDGYRLTFTELLHQSEPLEKVINRITSRGAI